MSEWGASAHSLTIIVKAEAGFLRMNEFPSNVPNLSGDRITAFHAAIDSFCERLREREQSEWADRLHGAQNQGEYAGDFILRLRTALREFAVSDRSRSTNEAIELLVECDAIWRGEFVGRVDGAGNEPKAKLRTSAPPRPPVKLRRHIMVGKHR